VISEGFDRAIGFVLALLILLMLDCGLRIADCLENKMRDEQGAKSSQDRRANDVGEIMRAEVHSGEPDQNRDWETGETDAPPCENQNAKKGR
jgi:hypothetical protein